MSTATRAFNLLYLGELLPDLEARLREAAPGIAAVAATTLAEATALAPNADVIAGSGRLFGAEVVGAATKLVWVQAMSAGVERFCPYLLDRCEVVLTNARGAHPIPIAEHFLAMLLGLTHRIPEFLTAAAKHQWRRLELVEVRGRTLLVLGLGNLGREIVAAAAGIGLDIIGYDPYTAIPAAAVRRLYKAEDLHAALAAADFAVSCIPLTPANRHFIGAPEFAALPRGAYFFNLSRGGVVDEAALVGALESGHLAGAGLDVFEVEPLPVTSPLWTMGNVIVTPHIAAASAETTRRTEDILVENAKRFAAGRPLVNQVDIRRGF